jgi:DnaK suppressor protein
MDNPSVRDALAAERIATQARIGAMTAAFEEMVAASVDANNDDEHDPEGSTLAFERAQVAALLLGARTALADLDRALARVDAGDYGNCKECGAPIAPERLAARPVTETCISCAASPADSPILRAVSHADRPA